MTEILTKPAGERSSSSERSKFLEALRTPSLLNFVCGIFALERAYDVMDISRLPGGTGHFWVVLLYTLGFLVGLLALWPEIFQTCRAWIPLSASIASYVLLVAGSVMLLYCVYGDCKEAEIDRFNAVLHVDEHRLVLSVDGHDMRCAARFKLAPPGKPALTFSVEGDLVRLEGADIMVRAPQFHFPPGAQRPEPIGE